MSTRKKSKEDDWDAKNAPQWYRGRLCTIINYKAWFIKPFNNLPVGYDLTKDVFMYPDNISKYVLPLKGGDTMEFVLGDRDKTKPMAREARVSQYSPRSCDEVLGYIKELIINLNSNIGKQVLVATLPNRAMWSYFASPVFTDQTEELSRMKYAEALLRLLNLVLHTGKYYKAFLESMIQAVMQGKIFQSTNEQCQCLSIIIKSCHYSGSQSDKFYSQDYKHFLPAKLVRMFCRSVVYQVPSVTRYLLPVINAMSQKMPNPQTDFLCDILSVALTEENMSEGEDWKNLPLIPTERELTQTFLENDKHLSRVNTETGYESSDEYMDTYFRLLRAETFSAVQHGIRDLKDGTLDQRDMNVYHNVSLAGFEIQYGRFSLAIHFTPAGKVKMWEASPQLMFGNLVCISLNRKFDDIIWATVSNRDTDVLNKHQVIMVEVINEKYRRMSEIMNSLQANAGSAVMVESPTYYHALNPILQSLKRFNMENFLLQDEVIYTLPSPCKELPKYLNEAESLDASVICAIRARRLHFPWESGSEVRMDVKEFLAKVKSNSMQTALEASQCEALIHALENRLAIIQGPPGCGKTFVGVKIVQLLLSLSPELEKPILLLTYKNHALDEFLKHMLVFCNKSDLVRIGGRSKEPELESCNLQSIMKSMAASRLFSKPLADEIRATRQSIEFIESQIKIMSSSFNSINCLTKFSFIKELTDEQLRSLILDVNWRESHSVYQVDGKKVPISCINNAIGDISQRHGSIKE